MRINPTILWAATAIALMPSAVHAQSPAAAPPPAVVVMAAAERDVTPVFEYPGRAEAVETVDIRARVEGFIEARNFREGSDVKAGDVLFKIERAPYEVVVDQRRAELASAQATLKNAEADFERKSSLVKHKDVAESTLDQSRAALDGARADVLRAQASLRAAQLDLDYTTIKSPISGRISRSKFSVGNLVSPTTETLATVTSYDPIYVTIQVSEKQLLSARKRGIDLNDPPVAPSLKLSDGTSYSFEGAFNYLAPSVDTGTDTVTARASFPNPNRVLLPGQFVSVIVRQKTPEMALVVPQVSVQQDSKGYFLLVVGEDETAQIRRVEIGRQVDSDWIVSDGLKAGEKVIVQGIQKARPGAKVKPTEQNTADKAAKKDS